MQVVAVDQGMEGVEFAEIEVTGIIDGGIEKRGNLWGQDRMGDQGPSEIHPQHVFFQIAVEIAGKQTHPKTEGLRAGMIRVPEPFALLVEEQPQQAKIIGDPKIGIPIRVDVLKNRGPGHFGRFGFFPTDRQVFGMIGNNFIEDKGVLVGKKGELAELVVKGHLELFIKDTVHFHFGGPFDKF